MEWRWEWETTQSIRTIWLRSILKIYRMSLWCCRNSVHKFVMFIILNYLICTLMTRHYHSNMRAIYMNAIEWKSINSSEWRCYRHTPQSLKVKWNKMEIKWEKNGQKWQYYMEWRLTTEPRNFCDFAANLSKSSHKKDFAFMGHWESIKHLIAVCLKCTQHRNQYLFLLWLTCLSM